jgi:hypothetical protein
MFQISGSVLKTNDNSLLGCRALQVMGSNKAKGLKIYQITNEKQVNHFLVLDALDALDALDTLDALDALFRVALFLYTTLILEIIIGNICPAFFISRNPKMVEFVKARYLYKFRWE